ncbi:MAG TPA: translation elongation factor Ts [Candidatus Saccharibacteria bacterium]|nr:translation elongation factor Ts [Candidatus Saccharibacteria bacterium]HMT55885.1 translation elongation factor Ts [Candidatus Saccharibacteria bacterium]
MAISIEEIKRLKDLTGVGLTDAKAALTEADGDFDKALEAMRKKGMTKAEKRGEREAREGVIGSYIHDNRIGVIVEVNCETDFVAKNEKFTDLVKDVAMHIAASAPEYVSAEEIPAEIREKQANEFTEKVVAEGKPADKAPMIVEGMLKKYFAERCLMDQPFIKNPDQTVGDLVKEANAQLGENVVVRRFSRMQLGEVA